VESLPQEVEPEAQPVTTKPDNIWDRLFKGYTLHKPYNKRFAREYNWYRKHPQYFKRVQERAEPYLHFILEEAEKRSMPTELVLLPVVESAFQPFAYSPGRAAGLWQFIPSTGRMYGLHQNWWYDGRRDVMASTRAALDYLQSLSKQFDGDWNLALASYNAGAGNVRRAIRKNKKKNLPTDYWSLKLPKETMTYVPRLLAISQVFANAHEIGLTLKPIANEPQLAEVRIDNQIDLAKAADMAGLTIEELYQLNPALVFSKKSKARKFR
jgi:membrane-bound lytic murein transglycosylase D